MFLLKIRRILLTKLTVVNLQTKAISTGETNNINKLTSLDINHEVHKPVVTIFYKRIETDIKEDPVEKLYKKSFRKAAMHRQTDTFELNGYIAPMSCLWSPNQTTPLHPFVTNWRWYVTTKDQGGPVKQSGGGLGKIDSKGEAGFFHKVNLSRLEQIRKLLKEKRLEQQKDAPKDDSDAKK